MEAVEELVYDINLCGICQYAENVNFTSMLAENISEHGTTYLDLLKYIFPEVEWILYNNMTPMICKVCLETIKEIVDFKKICLDMNSRRAFYTFTNISIMEQVKIEIIPDGIEQALMQMEKDNFDESVSTNSLVIASGQDTLPESLELEVISEIGNYKEEVLQEEPVEYNEENVAEIPINNICNTKENGLEVVNNNNNNDGNVEEENDNELEVDCEVAYHEEVDEIPEVTLQPIIVEKQKKSIYQAKFQTRKDDRQCKECKEQFRTWEALKDHITTNHVILRKFRCNICEIGFISRDTLNRHMYKHDGTRNYACSICGRRYITRGDYSEHMKFHQADAKHACPVCNARFKTASNLRTHAAIHTDPKDYKFLCVMCGNKYCTSTALADHILHLHNTRSVPCKLCNKKFYAQKDLTRHMVRHSDEQKFSCPLCDKKFKRKYMLILHKMKLHGIGDHKLEKPEKKLECRICYMKVTNRSKLIRHIRTHTGVRPFKCRLCEKKFICASYIPGHLKQKHSIDVETTEYEAANYYDVVESDNPEVNFENR